MLTFPHFHKKLLFCSCIVLLCIILLKFYFFGFIFYPIIFISYKPECNFNAVLDLTHLILLGVPFSNFIFY